MDFGSLPATQVLLVDRACDRFEAAWRAGGRPRIEDHLTGAPGPVRAALLESELEWRHRLGERPGPEEYRGRFPADGELVGSLLKAASTARSTAPRGTQPRPEADSQASPARADGAPGAAGRRYRIVRFHAKGRPRRGLRRPRR
jgi:serine/threonine-protein kinase